MMPQFTASERKVANVILADYPFTALEGIRDLAERTGVSAPSITRFVAKIGAAGFGDFQRQLIGELKEGRQSPLDLQVRQIQVGSSEFLTAYSQRLSGVLAEMAETISQSQFETICSLISDRGRNVFLIGGRVTDSIAGFLSIHLRQVRDRIYHIPGNPELQPEYVLRMRRKDVVIFFDFRRYQRNLQKLAELVATERQASIILITDKWISPIARSSAHIVALPIEVGTAWDTATAAVAFVEALIVKVSETDWSASQERIRAWDRIRFNSDADQAPNERDEDP
jgi:DNA-binding MurR/RpiR family transcriptional regulator